jgi:hypothetical protein
MMSRAFPFSPLAIPVVTEGFGDSILSGVLAMGEAVAGSSAV